jgi:hypothetical protein
VLGYACYASDSNVSRISHYCLPHSRGLSGETSSTPVSRRAQSLVETPSHPAYLASYWSICLGSQLIMAQDSQSIDTVRLMHSGRLLPLFKPRLVPPPQAGESDPTLVCVRVDSENSRLRRPSPAGYTAEKKKKMMGKTQTDKTGTLLRAATGTR